MSTVRVSTQRVCTLLLNEYSDSVCVPGIPRLCYEAFAEAKRASRLRRAAGRKRQGTARPTLRALPSRPQSAGSAQTAGCAAAGKTQKPAGATRWQLPHPRMPLTFQGRSPAQLCRQLLNPKTNGGHSPEALIEHVEEDPLVHWGWQPGAGRSAPPGTHQEFVDTVRVWIENGPACPADEVSRERTSPTGRFGIAGWRAGDQNVGPASDKMSGRE